MTTIKDILARIKQHKAHASKRAGTAKRLTIREQAAGRIVAYETCERLLKHYQIRQEHRCGNKWPEEE